GAAHARNRGIAEVGGTVTVFLDDDVVPEPGWLRALLAPIVAGRADGTGGRVVLDPAVPRPRWLDERGIGGFLTRFEPTEVEVPVGPREFVITANAAFATDVLRRTAGFDAELGPRGRLP